MPFDRQGRLSDDTEHEERKREHKDRWVGGIVNVRVSSFQAARDGRVGWAFRHYFERTILFNT